MLEYIRTFVINDDVEANVVASKNIIDVKGVALYKVGKDEMGMDRICKFETEKHRDAVAPELEISFGAGTGDKLLEIRVGLHRDTEASYANYYVADLERPFMFEFPADYTVEDMVNLINEVMGASDLEVFKAEVKGSGILIKGYHGTQSLKAKTAISNGETSKHEAMWTSELKFPSTEDAKAKAVGTREFGTYENLIHDLRLPTIENFNYFSPNKYEMPIAGKKYDLYVFDYNSGLTHRSPGIVGARYGTFATHKFWVATDLPEDAVIRKVLSALEANTASLEASAAVEVKEAVEAEE